MNEEKWGQWIETQRTLDREPGIALMQDGQAMRQYFIKEELSIIPCRSHVHPFLREKLGSRETWGGITSQHQWNTSEAGNWLDSCSH